MVLSRRASVALVAAIGCRAQEPPLVNPGVSDVKPEMASARRPAPDAAAVWEHAGETSAYRALGKGPFPSQGHFADRWTAEVLGNEPAAIAFATLARSTVVPQGAVLMEKLAERATGTAGPIFAMEKRASGYFPAGGDWKYVVTDAAGRIEDEGQLSLCARCHAEAPADYLFGLPPDARR
jgi:hypothetical protein